MSALCGADANHVRVRGRTRSYPDVAARSMKAAEVACGSDWWSSVGRVFFGQQVVRGDWQGIGCVKQGIDPARKWTGCVGQRTTALLLVGLRSTTRLRRRVQARRCTLPPAIKLIAKELNVGLITRLHDPDEFAVVVVALVADVDLDTEPFVDGRYALLKRFKPTDEIANQCDFAVGDKVLLLEFWFDCQPRVQRAVAGQRDVIVS